MKSHMVIRQTNSVPSAETSKSLRTFPDLPPVTITNGTDTINFRRLGRDSWEITGTGFPQPVYTDRATAERTFEGRVKHMGYRRAA